MKRLIIIAVLSIIIFSGCSASRVQRRVPDQTKNSIISNSYKFERISQENAPSKVINLYKQNRENQMIIITDDGAYTYIIALMGRKPTGGYTIKIQSIEDNEEGKLKVTVKFNVPGKDSIVTQAITYPIDIVRINKTNLPFYGVDTAGKIIKVEKK